MFPSIAYALRLLWDIVPFSVNVTVTGDSFDDDIDDDGDGSGNGSDDDNDSFDDDSDDDRFDGSGPSYVKLRFLANLRDQGIVI
jgi:hypothetical protein